MMFHPGRSSGGVQETRMLVPFMTAASRSVTGAVEF